MIKVSSGKLGSEIMIPTLQLSSPITTIQIGERMRKRKTSQNKWLNKIKRSIVPNQSKHQPYNPEFIPYAVKNRSDFMVNPKSHCAKNQGVIAMTLLNRGYKAMNAGAYEKP